MRMKPQKGSVLSSPLVPKIAAFLYFITLCVSVFPECMFVHHMRSVTRRRDLGL